MSFSRTYPKSMSMAFSPRQWTILHYYSWKYRIQGYAAVARQIVEAYAEGDKAFDPDEYLKYVTETLAPSEEDPRMKEAIIRDAEEYVAGRKRGKKR